MPPRNLMTYGKCKFDDVFDKHLQDYWIENYSRKTQQSDSPSQFRLALLLSISIAYTYVNFNRTGL